jgi:hypothetical protein
MYQLDNCKYMYLHGIFLLDNNMYFQDICRSQSLNYFFLLDFVTGTPSPNRHLLPSVPSIERLLSHMRLARHEPPLL